MPIQDGGNGQKFITTEAVGPGLEGEQKVWEAVKSAFSDRNCIAYWRYPIFSKTGGTFKEPDILIAERKAGLIVIEVKSFTIQQIQGIDGHRWEVEGFGQGVFPYQQAQNQLRALLSHFDPEPRLWRSVAGKALVALPFITEAQWKEQGFDSLPCNPPIIFGDQLGNVTLPNLIKRTPALIPGNELDDEQWELLLAHLGGSTVFRKPEREVTTPGKSRSAVLREMQDWLYQLDLQQAHIGLEIPPGPQRIRGIAGSGKTVLLCQKAAHMHLKHPEWEIALVFFTRALYDTIKQNVDRWLKHFSNGTIDYAHVQHKLHILHAWGANDQPGLYGEICHLNMKRFLASNDTPKGAPNRKLAYACKSLLEDATLKPVFDAVLIDEGQDLVVEDDLKYQQKQAIYWMAYQALCPSDPNDQASRRLIWAYDEAQSLDSLKIPSAKEIFGEELSQIVVGNYKGGIKKSEIMHRCYRTPGSVLTAAHALGMGLLRRDGMLSGLTTKEDWKSIGYEVEGQFLSGRTITLRRPEENSPNPIGKISNDPLIAFTRYQSRDEELRALAKNIRHNLEQDGLSASRELLIIVLGTNYESPEISRMIGSYLNREGISYYIPSALEPNIPNPQYPNLNRSKFWHEGAVTVSQIHRAKGNEAEMVYVVGLDNIARKEDNIPLRNQLFVAITRARGWVSMSGVGDYPMYQEVKEVIDSNGTYTFTFKRPPTRDMGEKTGLA